MIKDLLSFSKDELFENLSENDKKDLLSNCSLIFANPAFKKVCDEVYTEEITRIVNEANTAEDLAFCKGKIHGITSLFDLIRSYHLQYLESVKKPEQFNKHDVI